jgi:cell division septal protein FtsQ
LAVNIHASTKYKSGSLLSRQTSFQRKSGKIETKRIQGKWKLKIKHIAFVFILLVGFFYGFSRLYLFLISWERLNIKEVEIVCAKAEIQRDIRHYFGGKYLGNIILLDIGQLQNQLASHRWIKSIHIRKIFLSSIKIDIKERIPTALLQKEQIYLIDREGVLLEQVPSDSRPDLPLLIDKGLFQRNLDQKLALAWDCLETLEARDREKIAAIDLSDYENLSLRLEDSETWLKLGNDRFYEKMQLFHKNMALFEKYSPLEYIDFRCQDRLILHPFRNHDAENGIDSGKEVL